VISNEYYSQDVHGPYELHDIGELILGLVFSGRDFGFNVDPAHPGSLYP
jgi:hypothetical protein